MSEVESLQTSSKNQSPRSKLLLPLIIGSTILIISSIFLLGFLSLTTPTPLPEDVHSLVAKKQQEREQAAKEISTEEQDGVAVNEDGTFDFAKYNYFSFPLPFVINFADDNGMVTLEIAIATYETTLRSEILMESLKSFTPKMRASINLIVAEQVYENVNTVAKRQALEKILLEEVKKIIHGDNPEEPSGITDLHFTKFIITGIR